MFKTDIHNISSIHAAGTPYIMYNTRIQMLFNS